MPLDKKKNNQTKQSITLATTPQNSPKDDYIVCQDWKFVSRTIFEANQVEIMSVLANVIIL